MDRKLPDWLKESREAEKLIAWLKSPDCEVKEFSEQLFIKAKYGNCFFFFDCLKENRKNRPELVCRDPHAGVFPL